MKRALLLLMYFVASYAMAQDVIVMRNGTSILSKVLEITSTEVKYKKHSNLDGPTFSVLKTEVLVINYENGEKESFEAQENIPAVGGNSTDLQSYSYEQLESMMKSDAQFQKGLKSKSRKVKAIKIVGWTVGGLTAAIGLTMTIAGINGRGEYYSSGKWEYESNAGIIAGGVCLFVAGAAVTTGCLIRANKLKNNAVLSINSTPLFQHDFRLKNGNTLAASVDLLNDSRLHERTFGLGFHYNF